jgi:hypothetical protein
MSIAVLINWSTNFIVGLTFPLMKRSFDNYVFLPFTCFLAIFWTFTYHRVPETKNRTFDEIAALFKKKEEPFTSDSIESFQTPCHRKSVQSDIVYGTTTVTPVLEQQQHQHHLPSQQIQQQQSTSLPVMTTAAVIQDDPDSVILHTGVEAGIIGHHPDAHPLSYGIPVGTAVGPPINLYEQQTLAQQSQQQQPPAVLCQNAMAVMAAAGITAGNHVYQPQWTVPCPSGNVVYQTRGNQEYEL